MSLLVFALTSPHPAAAQSTQTQGPQLSSMPLPQLYWAFFSYQNHLDALAAQREAQGIDGGWLRDDLQKKLGFSDAEFAPIRSAAEDLASKVTVLSKQVRTIQNSASSSMSASARAQAITALSEQRQSDIDNEIYNLSQELSPQDKTAFEKFLKQFFAPKKISFRAPTTSGLPAGEAVQK